MAALEDSAAAPAIAKYQADKVPGHSELLDCVDGAAKALSWIRSSVRLSNLATCEFGLASKGAVGDPDADKWQARAEEHQLKSLKLNPLDGYAWLRLAIMRSRRGAQSRDVVAALVMSLTTAPNVRSMWNTRAWYLLRYVPMMTVEELTMVRDQLRTIWQWQPESRRYLVETAFRNDRWDMLTWSLRDDRDAMTEVEKLLQAIE